ncbi:hypothetical protein FDECE_10370 [Fusarium decemcellulare]|nr:hypothetical protein FDECE_10370 [Fusarium decemcellulare]
MRSSIRKIQSMQLRDRPPSWPSPDSSSRASPHPRNLAGGLASLTEAPEQIIPDVDVSGSSEQRERFIAIGIDFGTTFSGASWAYSEKPDQIYEVSEWPAADFNDRNEVQVPTLYDLNSGAWGYMVTPDMVPVKWFKLLLLNNKDLSKEDIRHSEQLTEARKQLAEHPKGFTVVQVVGFYLKRLWEHTKAYLRTKLQRVEDIPFRVSITVPAIWPPYAQSAMREAAKLAGITDERAIGPTTLELVQEPEAAGLSIMLERSELSEIQKDEAFVVCDAGGGTVDVISYKVVSDRPFRLKECVKGDGKLCGAVRIDEAFEDYLEGRDKLKLKSLSESEYNTFFIQDWERGVKRNFTMDKVPEHFSLRLPNKAYKTMDRIRNKDNFSMSRADVTGFFGKSLTGIRRLVNDQCNILLVGGLGSSRYIYDILNAQFDGAVLRPLKGWSAVARGAVIRLLRERFSSCSPNTLTENQQRVLSTLPAVTSRKSRYSYGVVVNKWLEDVDDYDETYDQRRRNPEGIWVIPRMDWYLKKGDDVSVISPVCFEYSTYRRQPPPEKCTFYIRYSSADSPPIRNDSTVLELCTIQCDYDRPFHEWPVVGNPDKGYRICSGLELMMKFEGELKWTLGIGSKKAQRDVEVEYMVE